MGHLNFFGRVTPQIVLPQLSKPFQRLWMRYFEMFIDMQGAKAAFLHFRTTNQKSTTAGLELIIRVAMSADTVDMHRP